MDHATELVAQGIGLAVLGPAGVGKSRLIHEVAALAAESGVTVVPVVASAATRTIPFAPFVELLPPGPTQDELMMLATARAALEEFGASGDVLVTIDDAHELDRVSLAFLVSIVSSGTATVAITARTGEPMEADLVDLWTNGVIERVDLEPLGQADVSALLERALGPIAPELEDELWRLTRGNPLVLHEMVEGAVGSALSRADDQLWSAVGSLAESSRLSDLVLSRLGALPDRLRAAMDVVAVGAPIPLAVARAVVGEDLAELEDRGLVEVAGGGQTRIVIPAHPLYGEILAASLGEMRRRAALRRLVDAAVEVGPSNPDPLRAALWQNDYGEVVEPTIALAGARAALGRHDPDLAAQLLDRLDPEQDQVAVLLGRSLSYRQHFERAEAALAGRMPSDPGLAAEIASIRGQNLAFGLGRVGDARAVFEVAASTVADPDLRARLVNERAMVSAVLGDFDDAIVASEQILSDPSTSDPSTAAAYVTLSVALGMTGQSERLASQIDRARAVALRASEAMPLAQDQIEIMWAIALVNAGRLGEASAVAEDAANRGNALTSGTLLGTRAMVAIESGALARGVELAKAALQAQQRYDPFGLVPQSLGLIALANGQMGLADGADQLDQISLPAPAPRLTIWIDRGRAWATAATGDLDGAARIAADGGRAGIAGDHFAWALLCLHDAVRFGHPGLVIDEIRSIETPHGAAYLVALQNHAESLLERDPRGLSAVGQRFGEFGSSLLMAEAFARASRIHVESGDEAQAARACAIAKSAGALCEEARTPGLAACSGLVTDREVQVAVDAARGLTSPEIAELRYISVRTVDNHLRSVYRKMDISGRDELAEVLVPLVHLRSKH